MISPLVIAILLNWNNSDDTIACLKALAVDPYPGLRAIVIDNGSADDSVAQIRSAFPDIPIIQSPTNRGFAGGVNQGLQYAAAHAAAYALLLNSDITILPDTITQLVAAAKQYPAAGILGPKVFHNLATRTFSMLGFQVGPGGIRLLGWHAIDHGQFNQTRVDAISGCAMLISSAALFRVGLFDQRFFFYFEDIDYCLRAAAAGFEVRVVPEAQIEHEMGGSTRRNLARRQFLLASHRMRFLKKHIQRFNPVLLGLSELRELINQLRGITQLGLSGIVGYLVGLWVGIIPHSQESAS